MSLPILEPRDHPNPHTASILSQAARWYGATAIPSSMSGATIVITLDQPDDEPPTAGVLAKLIKSR